jgi:hypothetical protein
MPPPEPVLVEDPDLFVTAPVLSGAWVVPERWRVCVVALVSFDCVWTFVRRRSVADTPTPTLGSLRRTVVRLLRTDTLGSSVS